MASSVCKLALLLLVQSAKIMDQSVVDSQAAAAPSGPQRVEGRIARPGPKSLLPVADVWVTLHRVGSDRAAPMDSMRAGFNGKYAFTYKRSGDPDAIYFVSAMYSGIAYFTPPLRDRVVKGENAEITVFDTTSRNLEIGLRGHHIIVSSADASATRSITEVFELANDSSRTLVGTSGLKGTETWSTQLPAGATAFSVGQGDIPAAAVSIVNNRAKVFAPIAPGLRQFSFSYMLPGSAFPVTFPVAGHTSVFEVLLEDPQGNVTGPKLREVEPVSMERRQFRRFLGAEVPAKTAVVIDVPPTGRPMNRSFIVALTIIIGGAMLAALARAFVRR